MNLHEYQAKAILARYGLPVPAGEAVANADAVASVIQRLGGERWVVKTQVHAGGRGKAGGVKLVSSVAEATQFATQWLGNSLVTYQTDAAGQPVSRILVEACSAIERELYLGAVVDRSSRRVVFMASTEGGMEIEKVAAERPDKILKMTINPLTGAMPWQGRALAFALGLSGKQVNQFSQLFVTLSRLFHEQDLSLLEINPLVVTAAGDLLCLDAKVNIDGNALYRHPDLRELHDPTQEDAREMAAAQWDLNYVALDGNIGCMVNGAGLAMGTMDIIKLHGGNPANFLDVGGGATKERVAEAFKLILSDSKVRSVLVNIFGGIVRCDLIAEGIIAAVAEVGVNVPVVVRLEGNRAEAGRALLAASSLAIIAAASLTDAAQQAVDAAGGVA
ncbi:MAG: ADP-forming succinate--CoA ligase subunit beta [Gammaproteobacteria bacterium]|nr:ADP-forming succinate--CoA ligase subunit beta [Gammaproteobacteria bacterium]